MATAGVVTAARKEAAEAGASVLAAGGNAADAAVATAFALTVADPANCGVGGFGGYAVIDRGGSQPPLQVEFNTAPPQAFGEAAIDGAPRRDGFLCGGPAVSRPSVVPGLHHIHARFGRLPWADLLKPAIALADTGCIVGPDLARAFAWARDAAEPFAQEFWSNFAAGGDLTAAETRLRQPDLAQTLRTIARQAAGAFEKGPLVEAAVRAVQSADGVLSAQDFAAHDVTDFPAAALGFGEATIYGPRPEATGCGVLMAALAEAGSGPWPEQRNSAYVARVAGALRAAWAARRGQARSILARAQAIQHTTHLCTADGEGGLLALTFTHGPLWFGSGLVVPGTGVILNCGANLLARDETTGRLIAQNNVTPVIARSKQGERYALGTPGGYRIPAVVMTALIDVLAAGRSLAEAIALPRIATDVAGRLEVEPPLLDVAEGARATQVEEFYGPASGIAVSRNGEMLGATDPRFDGAVASVDRAGRTAVN